MPTDTPFTAALATEKETRWPGGVHPISGQPLENAANTKAVADRKDARGIPTMAQISALCGHKPPAVTDTAPSPSEARTMDSSANTHRPNDAERTLYRNGRTAEAVQMYRERVGGRDYNYCWNAFADDRDHAFSRAEAAARIVRCAREWASGGTHGDKGKAGELLDACDAYERLIEASE